MLTLTAVVVTVAVFLYTLSVRAKDLPAPEPISPFKHLEERKAAIYDNLRDLQFEYRLGKLSEQDYQQTKQDLQRELAAVLAQIDRGGEASLRARPAPKPAAAATACPHCGARFDKPMKFCGECGKPVAREGA